MNNNTRKLREKADRIYKDDGGINDDDIDGRRNFDVMEKVASNAYNADFVIEMTGNELTVEYFQRSGHKFPLVIHDRAGLGLRTPSENFRVSDVKKCVGSRRVLDVMDVETQKGMEMTLKEWEAYYENPHRDRLLNVISLEFSHTRLEQYVDAPQVVRQVDFINTAWPHYLKECHSESTNILEKMLYPKVQKYCLMSVGNCYTDFHVDFGGTSVWYHILRGQKIFWLIEPTDENLELYIDWVLSGKQGDTFFGDSVAECQKILLNQGDTFMIPSGWIHGVFTPVDSLVFGGNFLHSYNLVQQLKVSNIEDRTHVPAKFRFPFFTEMMWYVLAQYVRCLTGRNHFIAPETEDNRYHIKSELKNDYVHLTPFEVQGLSEVVLWLENLPSNKRYVPKDLDDVDLLLERVKDFLKVHEDDDHAEAVNGVLPIGWPESFMTHEKKAKKFRTLSEKSEKVKDPKSPKVVNINRRRRTRCKKCEACLREDCGECVYCGDMKKYGGPGKMKQSCKSRQCMEPIIPSNSECKYCQTMENTPSDDNYNHALMECSICYDIVHPACLWATNSIYEQGGHVNDNLPNSWECPKCLIDGHQQSTTVTPRAIKGSKKKKKYEDEDELNVLEDLNKYDYTIVERYDNADDDMLQQLGLTAGDDSPDECAESSDILLLLENTMEMSGEVDHSHSDHSSTHSKNTKGAPMDSNGSVTSTDTKTQHGHKSAEATQPSISNKDKNIFDSLNGVNNNKPQTVHTNKGSFDNITEVSYRQGNHKHGLTDNKDSVPKQSQVIKGRKLCEGKRVTNHSNAESKVLNTGEIELCKDAGVILDRVSDVMPILERFDTFDTIEVKEHTKKRTSGGMSILEHLQKIRSPTLDSSSESDNDPAGKRRRREVGIPKRYLE